MPSSSSTQPPAEQVGGNQEEMADNIMADNIIVPETNQAEALHRLLRRPPATPMGGSARSRTEIMLRMLATTITTLIEAAEDEDANDQPQG